MHSSRTVLRSWFVLSFVGVPRQGATVRWRLVLPFAALCLIGTGLVAVMYTAMIIDKGVRAYATGESLWSKGHKDAVHALELYLFSGDERHWKDYQEALAVPLSDRAARLAMERRDFDYEAAFQGFVGGRNHPADVPSLIRLYRLLGWHPRLATVVSVWSQADVHILELQALGAQIRASWQVAAPGNGQLKAYDSSLSRIDAAINPLETEFVTRLGASARWMQDTLDLVIVGTVLTMLMLAVYILAHVILLR